MPAQGGGTEFRMNERELVVLTGVSGAGKSTAIAFMEDVGYYCIDNMPPQLIPTFMSLLDANKEYNKVAVVADVRSNMLFDKMLDSIENVNQYGFDSKIIYLDITTPCALKRYKLTRRKHPLADRFHGNLEQAVEEEKRLLTPLRLRSDFVIDTTELTQTGLKERLTKILLGGAGGAVQIYCESFGFKYGIPMEADFVLDVRCLPNPYWIDELKGKNGMDAEVDEYVFQFEDSKKLLEKLFDLADYLLALYVKEGKSQVVFAIGCTGGCHRSVAFAQRLAKHLSARWNNVSVNHRDILKK